LVMIEAMACGTPVLGFRNGSVPEVIDSGITGEVVGVAEAICKIGSVLALDRGRVPRRFDMRFTGIDNWILFKIFMVMPVTVVFFWWQARLLQNYRQHATL
jgi:hypothetical protein